MHPCEALLRSQSKAKNNRFLPIYQFADEANKKITHLDDFAATLLVKYKLGHPAPPDAQRP